MDKKKTVSGTHRVMPHTLSERVTCHVPGHNRGSDPDCLGCRAAMHWRTVYGRTTPWSDPFNHEGARP